MAYAVGQIVGCVIGIYLIMRFILLAFGKKELAPTSILASGGMAFAFASVVAGYGSEGGRQNLVRPSWHTRYQR
jgi:hypothetical protein